MASEVAAASGMKQVQQAQEQLENAINGVLKAEQQLRENTREVSLLFISLLHPDTELG